MLIIAASPYYILLCLLRKSVWLLSSVFFYNQTQLKKQNSNRLDPDQTRRFVGPDLVANSLQRLSTDDTSRQSGRLIYSMYYYMSS